MRNFFNRFSFVFLFVLSFLLLAPLRALADGADVPADQFFGQVLDLIKGFGGMTWMMKIAAIMLLIVSSMKVSFLRPLWDKLGAFKAFAAPALSLVAGVLGLPEITLAGVFAYLFAGAGALVLHELLDAMKGIPGIGDVFLKVIELIEKLLGAPKTAPLMEMKK